MSKITKTAVEWLFDRIIEEWGLEIEERDIAILEQAKEMENRQLKNYAEFAIHCDREGMKILNFNDYIKL